MSARVDLAHMFADQVHCPDCNSDAELIEQFPGVHVLLISHDRTCPILRQIMAGRGPQTSGPMSPTTVGPEDPHPNTTTDQQKEIDS